MAGYSARQVVPFQVSRQCLVVVARRQRAPCGPRRNPGCVCCWTPTGTFR
ncbi:PilI type IV pilus biogenesis protein [Pseudomonas cichorii]|nr:PilI type IV pilus biogenesis protein [Pseudomonas cichorii]MBX8493987.1 PilI type IV pilus biogenesis protein [Pseudomonas cichorii]